MFPFLASQVNTGVRKRSTLVDIFIKKDDLETMWGIFNEFRLQKISSGFPLYSSMFGACMKHGDLSKLMQLISFAKDDGITFEERFLTPVFTWLARKGNTEQLLQLLDQAKLDKSIDAVNFNVTRLINAVDFGDDTKTMMQFLRQLVERGFYFDVVHAFSSVIERSVKVGDTLTIVEAYEQMAERGLMPYDQVCTFVGEALANNGQIKLLTEFVDRLLSRRKGPSPSDLYPLIAKTLIKRGDISGLHRVLDLIRRTVLDHSVMSSYYLATFSSLAEMGDSILPELVKLYHQMVHIDNIKPPSSAIALTLRALVSKQGSKSLEEFLSEMNRLKDTGQIKEANDLQMLETLEEAAKSIFEISETQSPELTSILLPDIQLPEMNLDLLLTEPDSSSTSQPNSVGEMIEEVVDVSDNDMRVVSSPPIDDHDDNESQKQEMDNQPTSEVEIIAKVMNEEMNVVLKDDQTETKESEEIMFVDLKDDEMTSSQHNATVTADVLLEQNDFIVNQQQTPSFPEEHRKQLGAENNNEISTVQREEKPNIRGRKRAKSAVEEHQTGSLADSLEKLTVNDLKQQLKQLHLPSSGLKRQLIERLVKHKQQSSQQ